MVMVMVMNSYLIKAIISSLIWIICETLGGLLFLSLGYRLWTYQILPVWFQITSPVIWLIAFLLMPPFFAAYQWLETEFLKENQAKVLYRSLFVVIVGCVSEVLINEFIFRKYLGKPLYIYDQLPTFAGSGSLLSPFYYLTLYIHFPINQWLSNRASLVLVKA